MVVAEIENKYEPGSAHELVHELVLALVLGMNKKHTVSSVDVVDVVDVFDVVDVVDADDDVAFVVLKLPVGPVAFAISRFVVADAGPQLQLQQLLRHICFVAVVVNSVGVGYGCYCCCYVDDDGGGGDGCYYDHGYLS